MPIAAILLRSLAGWWLAPESAPPSSPPVVAVVEELDRISSRPLWPGFDPRRVPIEVFEGGRSWLLRHPDPPAEFRPYPGAKGLAVFEGRHESLRANTAIVLNGVTTATASFEGPAQPARRLAGLLVHEAFHVFQGKRHPKWGGNEVEQLVYPVEDAEVLALRRMESEALGRALSVKSRRAAGAWGARALAFRRLRFARLPEDACAYERGTEWKEGLAQYVEMKASGHDGPLLPPEEFPPQAVRLRAYASGAAIGLVLDRLDASWKGRLEKKDDVPLDELLRAAVAGVEPAGFSAAREDAARRRASEEVSALGERRAALAREFLGAPGWRVIVESEDPLFPQGFDPWNVERLSASEVLHTRWIKLGNSRGSLEVLDRHSLTEGSGNHPLFEGVRRATITGLPAEPRVEETGGAVRVSGEGVTLEFRGAVLTRSDQTLLVRLPLSQGK